MARRRPCGIAASTTARSSKSDAATRKIRLSISRQTKSKKGRRWLTDGALRTLDGCSQTPDGPARGCRQNLTRGGLASAKAAAPSVWKSRHRTLYRQDAGNDAGKKELEKTNIRMRAEGEMGHEGLNGKFYPPLSRGRVHED